MRVYFLAGIFGAWLILGFAALAQAQRAGGSPFLGWSWMGPSHGGGSILADYDSLLRLQGTWIDEEWRIREQKRGQLAKGREAVADSVLLEWFRQWESRCDEILQCHELLRNWTPGPGRFHGGIVGWQKLWLAWGKEALEWKSLWNGLEIHSRRQGLHPDGLATALYWMAAFQRFERGYYQWYGSLEYRPDKRGRAPQKGGKP